MKFKIIDIEVKYSAFGLYPLYTIESLCKRYTKTVRYINNHSRMELGNVVDTHNIDCFARAKNRLAKIGIDIEYASNVPWIYLDKVNGMKVTEINEANHGFCVGYCNQLKHLTYRREMFNNQRLC